MSGSVSLKTVKAVYGAGKKIPSIPVDPPVVVGASGSDDDPPVDDGPPVDDDPPVVVSASDAVNVVEDASDPAVSIGEDTGTPPTPGALPTPEELASKTSGDESVLSRVTARVSSAEDAARKREKSAKEMEARLRARRDKEDRRGAVKLSDRPYQESAGFWQSMDDAVSDFFGVTSDETLEARKQSQSRGRMFLPEGASPERLAIAEANIEGKMVAPAKKSSELQNLMNVQTSRLKVMEDAIIGSGRAIRAGSVAGAGRIDPSLQGDYQYDASTRGTARDVRVRPDSEMSESELSPETRAIREAYGLQGGYAESTPGIKQLIDDYNALRKENLATASTYRPIENRRQELDAALRNLQGMQTKAANYEPPERSEPPEE